MREDNLATKLNNGKAVAEALKPVLVPGGEKLINLRERQLWRAYTRARPWNMWREDELYLVLEVVRLYTRIVMYQKELDLIGAVVFDRFGSPKVNPMQAVIDSCRRRELLLRRGLGLTGSDTLVGDGTTIKAQMGKQKALVNATDSVLNNLPPSPSESSVSAFTPLALLARPN